MRFLFYNIFVKLGQAGMCLVFICSIFLPERFNFLETISTGSAQVVSKKLNGGVIPIHTGARVEGIPHPHPHKHLHVGKVRTQKKGGHHCGTRLHPYLRRHFATSRIILLPTGLSFSIG